MSINKVPETCGDCEMFDFVQDYCTESKKFLNRNYTYRCRGVDCPYDEDGAKTENENKKERERRRGKRMKYIIEVEETPVFNDNGTDYYKCAHVGILSEDTISKLTPVSSESDNKPESSDIISRYEVNNIFRELSPEDRVELGLPLKEEVDHLPSAQPVFSSGEWVEDEDHNIVCSKCGVKAEKGWSYCPYCGNAKVMEYSTEGKVLSGNDMIYRIKKYMYDRILKLKPVKAERLNNIGNWTEDGYYNRPCVCSKCGREGHLEWNCCPHCGNLKGSHKINDPMFSARGLYKPGSSSIQK